MVGGCSSSSSSEEETRINRKFWKLEETKKLTERLHADISKPAVTMETQRNRLRLTGPGPGPPPPPPSPVLTLLGVRRQQGVLPVGQDEGQRGQDGGVQNPQQGQDVGPVDRAVPRGEAAHLGGGVRTRPGSRWVRQNHLHNRRNSFNSGITRHSNIKAGS